MPQGPNVLSPGDLGVDGEAVAGGDANEHGGQSLLERRVEVALVATGRDGSQGRELVGLPPGEAGKAPRHPRPAILFGSALTDVVDGCTEGHRADGLPRRERGAGLEAVAVENVERAPDDLDQAV